MLSSTISPSIGSSSNRPTSSGAPSGRGVWSIGFGLGEFLRARVTPLSFSRRAVTSTRLSSVPTAPL